MKADLKLANNWEALLSKPISIKTVIIKKLSFENQEQPLVVKVLGVTSQLFVKKLVLFNNV